MRVRTIVHFSNCDHLLWCTVRGPNGTEEEAIDQRASISRSCSDCHSTYVPSPSVLAHDTHLNIAICLVHAHVHRVRAHGHWKLQALFDHDRSIDRPARSGRDRSVVYRWSEFAGRAVVACLMSRLILCTQLHCCLRLNSSRPCIVYSYTGWIDRSSVVRAAGRPAGWTGQNLAVGGARSWLSVRIGQQIKRGVMSRPTGRSVASK
jgi:hypothetical protein